MAALPRSHAIIADRCFAAPEQNPESPFTRQDQNGLPCLTFVEAMRSSLIAASLRLDETPESPSPEKTRMAFHGLTFHDSRFETTLMHSAFLALGDSYTIGEGVPDDANWPAQLAARLRADGAKLDGPRVVAKTGWTTDELAAAVDAAAFEPPYALVTLSIGVNNQYRGRPLEEYRVQFRTLLRRAVSLAGRDAARVVVVSIPDWGVMPFAEREGRDAAGVAREIDTFNAVACGETDRTGAHWVDVTAISRAPASRGELVDDGLHPSRAQYARWVDAILPVARAALGGR